MMSMNQSNEPRASVGEGLLISLLNAEARKRGQAAMQQQGLTPIMKALMAAELRAHNND